MTDRNPMYYRGRSLTFLPDGIREFLFNYILPSGGHITSVIDGDKVYSTSFVDINTDKYIAGPISRPFDYHNKDTCEWAAKFMWAVRIPGTDKAVFYSNPCEAYKKLYNKE